MHLQRQCGGGVLRSLLWLAAAPCACAVVGAQETSPLASATADRLWQRSLAEVQRGDFAVAARLLKDVRSGGGVARQVSEWLDDYEVAQRGRAALDVADFDTYCRYAKRRIERKEFGPALDWAFLAHDVAEDREAFLKAPWLTELVAASLADVDPNREQAEWRKVWSIYSRLSALFERNSRYRKLEDEAITHLRLDAMFDEDHDWSDRLQQVRWEEAEQALNTVHFYYVTPADFQAIAISGLEHLLLLSESKTAQERFERLKDEGDRFDFQIRVQRNLARIRKMRSVGRKEVLDTFRGVVKDINPQTIQLPEELIVSELMRGALEPLDDFTTLIWPRSAEEFTDHTRGDFVGVGISIIKNRQDEIEVASPLEDTPAYRAGILAGDIIVGVDGTPLKGYSLTKVVDTITGPKGTPVTLTIRRRGKEIEVPLVRARVKIHSVKGVVRDESDAQRWNHWLDEERRIGYVRLTNFQGNTVEDLHAAVAELQAQGLEGLVLDLRGNPGGLLSAAFEVASLFLSNKEEVVRTEGRIPHENQKLRTIGDGPFVGIPLTVLVDENSASASEIVAGAIKDNGRGKVIGTRTYGKFSVQTLVPLSRNNKASLKITTARYFLPSGVSLHRDDDAETWGVVPDITVRLVRKEKINVWQMRRDRDRIGPAPEPVEASEGKDETATPDAEAGAQSGEAGKTQEPSDAEPADEKSAGEGSDDELPPLDEPDENTRPKSDPQLDTALLVMRIELLARQFPTLADAQRKTRDSTHRR